MPPVLAAVPFIVGALGSVGSGIAAGAGAVGGALASAGVAGAGALGAAGSALGTGLGAAGSAIGGALGTAGSAVGGALGTAGSAIGGAASTVGSTLGSGLSSIGSALGIGGGGGAGGGGGLGGALSLGGGAASTGEAGIGLGTIAKGLAGASTVGGGAQTAFQPTSTTTGPVKGVLPAGRTPQTTQLPAVGAGPPAATARAPSANRAALNRATPGGAQQGSFLEALNAEKAASSGFDASELGNPDWWKARVKGVMGATKATFSDRRVQGGIFEAASKASEIRLQQEKIAAAGSTNLGLRIGPIAQPSFPVQPFNALSQALLQRGGLGARR